MEAEYKWDQFCEDNDIPRTFDQFMKDNCLTNVEEADLEWDKILQKYEEQADCIHTITNVVEDIKNGYFKVKCVECGYQWIDG